MTSDEWEVTRIRDDGSCIVKVVVPGHGAQFITVPQGADVAFVVERELRKRKVSA